MRNTITINEIEDYKTFKDIIARPKNSKILFQNNVYPKIRLRLRTCLKNQKFFFFTF